MLQGLEAAALDREVGDREAGDLGPALVVLGDQGLVYGALGVVYQLADGGGEFAQVGAYGVGQGAGRLVGDAALGALDRKSVV